MSYVPLRCALRPSRNRNPELRLFLTPLGKLRVGKSVRLLGEYVCPALSTPIDAKTKGAR